MARQRGFTGRLDYTLEDYTFRGMVESAVEATLDISYSISAYTPQSWEYPAEGGECEIENITIKSCAAIDENGDTWELTEGGVAALLDQINNDGKLLDKIRDYIGEHAAAPECCD